MSDMVSSYGITKKFDLIYQSEIKKKFKINYIHYNLANLYGPNDKFNPINSHVLGSLIYKFCLAEKYKINEVEIWGTGKPIRDFIYIDDAAKIIVETFKNISGIINIGSGKGTSIKELSQLIKKFTNYNGKVIFNKKKKDGVNYKVLSNKKLSKYYNLRKITNLNDGIIKTIDWFKDYYL
jgi:GDP-L-fucose synthase